MNTGINQLPSDAWIPSIHSLGTCEHRVRLVQRGDLPRNGRPTKTMNSVPTACHYLSLGGVTFEGPYSKSSERIRLGFLRRIQVQGLPHLPNPRAGKKKRPKLSFKVPLKNKDGLSWAAGTVAKLVAREAVAHFRLLKQKWFTAIMSDSRLLPAFPFLPAPSCLPPLLPLPQTD